MMFFQEVISDKVLFAEVLVILSVIGIQIYFFLKSSKEARVLKKIFKYPLRVESIINTDSDDQDSEKERTSGLLKLSSKSKNEVNLRIKESINNYLLCNRGGSVNYSIIKDIIDREVDAKEEEVSQSIPIPLYLGLAATIVGIIFGLFAMPELSQNIVANVTEVAGTQQSDLSGIDTLINGVKIAMVASLSGLTWTIILSSQIYNKASKQVLKDKNLQLNYLQETLLPELFKAEDAGVIGLKTSIDNFSRMTTNIVDEIKKSTHQSKANIVSQQETLDRIDKLNVTKISKANVELFNGLERNMESFHKFSGFVNQLSEISTKLADFSNKAGSIEKVANNIDSTLEESRDLTKFLTQHLQKIEEMSDTALYSVDLSEKRFQDAVNQLVESTADNVNSVKSVSDEIENNFNKVYDQLFIKLDDIAKLHIEQFTEAYNESLPRFQNLDHLSELEDIKLQLTAAFNSSSNGSEVKPKMNNLEAANKQLEEITNLLTMLNHNTKSLKDLSASRKSYFVRVWHKLTKWFNAIFRR